MQKWIQPTKAYLKKLLSYVFRPAGLVLIVGLAFAYDALVESTKVRSMALRSELYSNERWWYDRMAQHPSTYSILCEHPVDVRPEVYIADCIAMAGAGEGEVLPTPTNMKELRALLWSPEMYSRGSVEDKSRVANLRRAFDVAEVMFYSTERIYNYLQDDIMDEKEANTWLGVLHQVGPHPLLLAAADDAWRHGYVDPKFAQWFVDVMSRHPNWRCVLGFYPELTADPQAWVDKFKREEQELRFARPRGTRAQ
jgi:hypothetical protein